MPAIAAVSTTVGTVITTVKSIKALAEKGKKLLSDMGFFSEERFEEQLGFIDDFYANVDTLTFDYRSLDGEFKKRSCSI
ncbi:MAG: hypothetical protein AAF310_06160 [Myxococcota bacterium]